MTPDAFGLVALSALSLGLYNVACKHAVRDNSAVDVLLWSSVAGFAAFLAAAVALFVWRAKRRKAVAAGDEPVAG